MVLIVVLASLALCIALIKLLISILINSLELIILLILIIYQFLICKLPSLSIRSRNIAYIVGVLFVLSRFPSTLNRILNRDLNLGWLLFACYECQGYI